MPDHLIKFDKKTLIILLSPLLSKLSQKKQKQMRLFQTHLLDKISYLITNYAAIHDKEPTVLVDKIFTISICDRSKPLQEISAYSRSSYFWNTDYSRTEDVIGLFHTFFLTQRWIFDNNSTLHAILVFGCAQVVAFAFSKGQQAVSAECVWLTHFFPSTFLSRLSALASPHPLSECFPTYTCPACTQ